jgi:hypothetical protein
MKTEWALALGMVVSSGCSLSPETIQRIEGTPGQEGTGIFLSKLPRAIRILATHNATEKQRKIASDRVLASLAQLNEKELKKLPNYLAVDTEPDERSQGEKSVMLWDTQTEEIVGNDVYDVETPPEQDEVAQWNEYTARYIGAGATL